MALLPTIDGPANQEQKQSNRQKFLELDGVKDKIDSMATKFGVSSDEILSIIEKETGGSYSSAQQNFGGGSAKGLIQFLGDTKADGGTETFKTIKGKKYEIADLAKMDELEQLDVVELFFQEGLDNAGQEKYKPGELSLAVAAPAFIGKDDKWIEDWSKKNPEKYKSMMENNPGWVKDGKMTKSSITGFYVGDQTKPEAKLTRNEDGKLIFTDDDGSVKEFKSLAEFQNFQESQKKDTTIATDTKDLPIDMESVKAEYEKQQKDVPFGEIIRRSFQSVFGLQGAGLQGKLDALKGIKGLYNIADDLTSRSDFDDLTDKQKEDFILSLAEEKIRTGDADGSGQKMLDLIQQNRQEQKVIDFEKGLIRNSETGEVVDNMANVVARDITTARDKTDVNLGEQSNITEDANIQPIDKLTKDKDILNVLGSDSDEKTNPFKTEEVPIKLAKKEVTELETEEPEIIKPVKRERDEEDDVKGKGVVTEQDKERRRNLDVLASASMGLLAGGLGVRQMNKALEDIPIEEGPKLNAAWQAHMTKMRELAQSGLTAEEKASAQADLSKNYNLGVRNVMRAAGGSRAAFLANAGVLNANRVEGLLKLSAMDAAMHRKNMDAYGKQLQFENEFGRKTGEIDRKMAYDEATRKSALHGEIGNALIENALDNVNYAVTKQAQAPMLDRYKKFFEQQNLSQDLNTFGQSLERTQLNTEG